jgi:hypothetical protein
MIIKAMAIIRCPYCHAIIDENAKYCNNCGTQLLFPEDSEIEEDIPGEKIIDADVEEKDYTVDEPEGEKRPETAKDLDTEIDEDLEKEIREETEEKALDELIAEEEEKRLGDDTTEEVILVDEIEAAEVGAREESRELEEKSETAGLKEPEAEEPAKVEEAERGEEIKKPREEETKAYAAAAFQGAAPEKKTVEPSAEHEEEPVVEYVKDGGDIEVAATAGESALRPATFDTAELEGIGETVRLGKEKIDKYIEAIAEKKAEEPPLPDEIPEETPEPSTGTLPPWASTMKGAPVFPEDTGPVEAGKAAGGEPAQAATDEEVEIFPRRRAPDSTIGLPEKVTQAALPFDQAAVETKEEEEAEEPAEVEEGEEEGEAESEGATLEGIPPSAAPAKPARPRILPVREPEERRIEAAEEGEESAPRPPFSFSVFMKSKAFDVLFVGIFWLVALWLAAYSIGQSLFQILGSMSISMLLLYAVLVLLYFFLFKFFLGETLGDRLFRPRE